MKPAKTITSTDSTTNQNYQNQGTQAQDTSQNTTALQSQNQSTDSLSSFLNNLLSSSQQTGTTNLSSLQQPAADTYFSDLMKNYQGGTLAPTAYTGERVAGLTPDQTAAQGLAKSYATGTGGNLTGNALTANNLLLDPNYILNPQNIPGLQASKDANAKLLTQNLQENQLPGIRGSALLDNTYGGSRSGLAEGIATRGTNTAIANANAGMDMQAYQQGLQAMQNGIGMAGGTYNTGLAPSNTVSQVGAQNQNQQQAIDTAAQQANVEKNATGPAATLQLLQQLMGSQGQYGGTTTQAGSSNVQQSGNQVAQQLATMLGLNLGSGTASSEGTNSSSGTQQSNTQGTTTQTQKASTMQNLASLIGIAMMPFTFGASGAAVASSDIRLKDNLKFVRTEPKTGLGVWTWTWRVPREEPQQGFIAQEVMQDYPDSVQRDSSGEGYLAVNYHKLMRDFDIPDPRI